MASHTGKRRSLFGIDNAVYSESDAETISYDYDESSDDGENLSSDEFSSDRLRRWTMCNSVLQGLSHESGLLSTDVVDWSIFDACCRLSYVIGFSVCK